MLTPDNIYTIKFKETFGEHQLSHTIIFNITQVSEEEVNDLIKSGKWEEDARIIELNPLQLHFIQDKEETK
jgi:hypothetical protein